MIKHTRNLLLPALVRTIGHRRKFFNGIDRTAQGEIPATALALDLSPWHAGIGLSLRVTSDPQDDRRYEPDAWRHCYFATDENSPSLRAAAKALLRIYSKPPGRLEQREVAHLMFLGAAEALLDPDLARALSAQGIAAPVLTDELTSHYFEYLVLDPDEAIKANYCDLVLSQRITARLLHLLEGGTA